MTVLQDGGFDVVGTAADARDLIRMADAYRPDVIVADIQMPPDHADDGLRAALAIRAARPGTGVRKQYSTTAWAGTRKRWSQPSKAAGTRTSWARPPGRWSS